MLVINLHLERWETEYWFRCFLSDLKHIVSLHLEDCLLHFVHIIWMGKLMESAPR